MVVIGLGIPLLILYYQYKKLQTAGKRKAIMVLSILQTVFTSFYLLYVLIYLLAFFAVTAETAGYGFAYTIATALVGAFFLVFGVISAFGIVTAVLGYKAVANKFWTANADYNERVYIYGARNVNTGFTPPPQGNAAQQSGQYFSTAAPQGGASYNYDWVCSCGKKNPAHAKFCPACGKNRNNLHQ